LFSQEALAPGFGLFDLAERKDVQPVDQRSRIGQGGPEPS
jgi:hypothetical protein